MTITQITVHASTSFNHPFEQYANFKPGVTLTAELERRDDPKEKTKELQIIADGLVMLERQRILERLKEQRDRDVAIAIAEDARLTCEWIARDFQNRELDDSADHLKQRWQIKRTAWAAQHAKFPQLIPAPPSEDECPDFPVEQAEAPAIADTQAEATNELTEEESQPETTATGDGEGVPA
jgi:hypothetical protein